MEKSSLVINASVLLKVVLNDPYRVELVDNLAITPAIKAKVLIPYLGSLFESLLLRGEKPSLGVPRYALNEYLSLPGLIGERMFNLFDSDKDGFLGRKEFQDGFCRLFARSFEENLRLVYDLFDFDSDGKVSKEDLRTLLSHVPLAQLLELAAPGTPKEGQYTRRGGGTLESQEELVKLLERCMQEKTSLSFAEFSEMTEKVFLLLRRSCTIYQDFAQYCLTQNITDPALTIDSTPTPSSQRLLPSPELESLKMLTPFAPIKKMSPLLKSRAEAHSVLRKIAGKKRDSDDVKCLAKPQDGVVERVVITLENGEEEKKGVIHNPIKFTKPKRVPFIDKTGVADLVPSPLISTEGVRFASHRRVPSASTKSDAKKQRAVVVCACGNECKDGDKGVCNKCIEKLKSPSTEGYLYEKTDSRTLNRFWYTLVGNHIYRYNARSDTEHNGMYSVTGSFVREELAEIMQKKLPLYPLRIYFGPNQLVLYAIKKEECEKWVKALKAAIGYSNLSDYYELKEPLGKGKFGLVRAAIHKQTGARVAVKVIKKSKLSIEDLDLAKREIEILKVCQHPNIIRLLDTFENPDYIYIVLELLQGGDLYEYLNKRDFKVAEHRARAIIHPLATALYYLHSYGIVHRDIKLDNILMADDTEQSDVKLVDFGLSKMIGPNEFCTEPFGTFGYAAPEVLQGKPYDKAVDIWGLGVVLFILLVGHAPFEEESEEKLAMYFFSTYLKNRETIHKEPDYNEPEWLKISSEAKNCVQKMLTKDVKKRITLKELLKHPWLTMNCKDVRAMRENATCENTFRMNALPKPLDATLNEKERKDDAEKRINVV